MPSDYNHIDDFFRKKEKDSLADNSQQDKHWQQMKELLVVPGSSTVKIRTVNTKLYWQAAAGIILIAVFAFLLLKKPDEIKPAFVNNNTPHQSLESNPTKAYHQKTKQPISAPAYTTRPHIQRNPIEKHLHQATAQKIKQNISANDLVVRTKDMQQDKSVLSTSSEKPIPSSQSLFESEKQLELFFNQLKKPAQEFYVNAKRDTTIRCSEGTSLFIPANAFQTTLGLPVHALVKISIQEFYSFADIISNKLTTTSNGEMLITGGMLHIEAKAGNEIVQIKSGATLGLQMPAHKFDPQMQLFTAQTQSVATKSIPQDVATSNTGINWIPAGQKQIFYAPKKKMVTILNLTDNPEKVFYRHPYNPSKMKLVGKFVIPWYCSYSTSEIKQELEKKFARYYDEIRVRRGHKPWSAKLRQMDLNAEAPLWYESHYVGDTVTLHISTATRLKYITKEDSLKYEAQWQEELEDAINRNQSYSELMQVKAQYDFKISNLGWINCDRFKNHPKAALTDLVLSTGDFQDSYVHSILIFNRENVVVQGAFDKTRISFSRIPKGENVSVVCISVKNGKVYTCIRNLAVSNEQVSELQFSETSPEELKEKLRQFGTVAARG